jgi:2-amino-4-hydroxy-6-hydroxymethyldihydropteridine diphosphokinase
MATTFLITGNNQGDPKSCLRRAEELVGSEIGAVVQHSRLYESRAWGFETGEPFVNQVLVVETELSPREVLEKAQQIEQTLGRDRAAEATEKERTGQQYASRAIDIDILFYDDEIVTEEDLVIPHPLLHKRSFVLEPLCEVASDKVHPVFGKTITELRIEN